MDNHIFFKKIAAFTLVAALSFSCEGGITRKSEHTQATAQQKSEQNLVYGELTVKEQSDYLMIPVGLKDKNQDRLYSYENRYNYYYNNIIFYGKKDGKINILLNKKAIINGFDLLEEKKAGKSSSRYWLYQIIDSDTNGDQKLDTQDAKIGYLSDLSGNNLQQITPNNSQILNWTLVQSAGAIFIKILKDSDNDQKFTEKDETNFIRVNLDKPVIGSEIISDEIEQKIKSLLVK
ncbi:hypothetical protein NIES592_16610 [Fischerella major NIES-592]|uniref:Uncharacterized protein n=1 Tax=Fischerella major NIES-592 TaxID=210994 RepID=A0A1U7GX27_9CYAN|nr:MULTISPECIES: hypothetical protein [Fischerella]OKH12841.1 hypothetical protein NIES592_16610 [Fischerella major NIES-592]BAU05295.1 hypothetical protein FIS3754_11900 [Fischerella sp. NIES-3754]BCX07558.1 MAG: hypothetical protein KatS3mg066_1417 [Fischerella sp.]